MVQRMSAEPTGHKPGMRIVFATLAVLLALAPAAEAKSFRGETSQKRFASVVVGGDGLRHADPDQLQRALRRSALPLPERAPARAAVRRPRPRTT